MARSKADKWPNLKDCNGANESGGYAILVCYDRRQMIEPKNIRNRVFQGDRVNLKFKKDESHYIVPKLKTKFCFWISNYLIMIFVLNNLENARLGIK